MKIAMLLSGGVDSSVALGLLRAAGHTELTAYYLKIWLEDELAFLGQCPWEGDLEYVRAVCAHWQVPLEIIPLQAEYHQAIVEFALAELRAGRTPSPDILCNARIKFGAFRDRVAGRADLVASGHYARLTESPAGRMQLRRGPDPVKDQTYFLSRLSQDQLRRLRFPIGHLTKLEVRALAEEWQLPTRHRPDSQGICFLGKIKFFDFVRAHLGTHPGPIVDLATGRELGTHPGYWFFTIGQRQGLRLGGGPWYVARKDTSTHTIYVAHADRHLDIAPRSFQVDDLHWIDAPPANAQGLVKLRHGPHLIPAQWAPADADSWRVTLDTPDPGIAPGQTCVFYDGDLCLGAGTMGHTDL